MNPSDPLMTSFRWVELGDYDGEMTGVIVAADGHVKRATAIGRVASELDCDFVDLIARVVCVRSLTREEAWEDYGREQYNGWEGGPEEVPDDWDAGESGDFLTYVTDLSRSYPTEVFKCWKIELDDE